MTDYKKIREDIYEKHSKSFEKLHKSEMSMNTPNGYRPLYKKYETIAAIISQYDIYNMSLEEWQEQCMIHSNGSMHPFESRDIYRQLMREAGLL